MKKRTFLKSLTLAGLSSPFSAKAMEDWVKQFEAISPLDLADDEVFWQGIRKGYRLKPDYINLENGYYNFVPEEILEKYLEHIREVNFQGSYYMRTVQWDNKKMIAEKLAAMLGCGGDELIITRNTTESLDMIIGGFPWKTGDEAVFAEQDYGAMQDMFRQVSERNNVVLKKVSVPNHPVNDEEIVNLYAGAITE